MEETGSSFLVDPQFAEKVVDVVGLYLNPAHKALVVSVEENRIQALVEWATGAPGQIRAGHPHRSLPRARAALAHRHSNESISRRRILFAEPDGNSGFRGGCTTRGWRFLAVGGIERARSRRMLTGFSGEGS